MHLAPPFFKILDGQGYGGIERVILDIIEEQSLNKQNKIYLSAPNGTYLDRINICETINPIGFFNKEKRADYFILEHVKKSLDYIEKIKPDIVHNHDDYFFPFMEYIKNSLLTLHAPYEDFWDINKNRVFYNQNLVAISKRQKKIYEEKGVKVFDMIYNGIDTKKYEFNNKNNKNYLLSLSSIRPEKGQDIAIEIFDSIKKELNLNLIIAGNIGFKNFFYNKIFPKINFDLSEERDKFSAYCKLMIRSPSIVYVGEVNDEQKIPLYKNASIFLMPVVIEESFGLVAIESMGCGTPVIASKIGALPEIITKKTGYLLEHMNKKKFIDSVKYCLNLSRKDCREHATKNFDRKKMAENYLNIYRKIISKARN